MGTGYSGLNILEYNPDQPESCHFIQFIHNPGLKNSISPGTITALWEDRTDHLWIGIRNGGLNRIDLNSFQEDKVEFHHYDPDPFNPNSLSRNSVASLYEDRDGGC